jgi:DNA transposition AAA+ family ATPase
MLDNIDETHDLSAARLAEDLDALQGDALREKVREYIATHKVSQSTVGTLAGVAESTFSAWLKGHYKGVNSRVEDSILVWLRSVEVFAGKRKTSLRDAKFAHTVSAQRFIDAFEHAQALPDIAVISAGAGVGKTAACIHYKKTRPNVWHLTADPSLHSYGKMLDYLRDELGIPKMQPHKLTRAIADRLSNTQGLLIFDEANNISARGIDMLRSIHDRGGIGMVFAGNHEVWSRIDGGGRNGELAQVFSRVGIRVTVARPSNKDIEIILDTLEIADAKQRSILAAVAKEPGALRALDKVLGLAMIAAEGAGEPLSEARLMKSWSRFSGRKIGSAPV